MFQFHPWKEIISGPVILNFNPPCLASVDEGSLKGTDDSDEAIGEKQGMDDDCTDEPEHNEIQKHLDVLNSETEENDTGHTALNIHFVNFNKMYQEMSHGIKVTRKSMRYTLHRIA